MAGSLLVQGVLYYEAHQHQRMKLEWHMTAPHPHKRAHVHGADDGRVGWRWHAVDTEQVRPQFHWRSLCGLRPAWGWCGDLFANEMCERCRIAALKANIELPNWLERSSLAVYKERKKA